MAARRCSLCSINFPIGIGVCHVCGEPTAEMSNEIPHENWGELVEQRKAEQPSGPLSETDRVELWRLGALIRAGYSIDDAERLACSDVDLHRAVELVTACPAALAAEILL